MSQVDPVDIDLAREALMPLEEDLSIATVSLYVRTDSRASAASDRVIALAVIEDDDAVPVLKADGTIVVIGEDSFKGHPPEEWVLVSPPRETSEDGN